ncbi:hypothetical protein B1H38_15135 [Leptospira borgpetersenii serovar Ballum]|nr:hypothetical protein B1H38_15135 [Leptospira borgpetersenii serovar Ballum]
MHRKSSARNLGRNLETTSYSSKLYRRFQEYSVVKVFDKIEKEALKLYERSIYMRIKRMVVKMVAPRGFHGSQHDGSRQKWHILGSVWSL